MNWHRMLETCREIEEQFGLVLSPQARPADDLMEDQWLLSIGSARGEIKMFVTEAFMEHADERYLASAIGRRFLYMIHNPGDKIDTWGDDPERETRDMARWSQPYVPRRLRDLKEAKPFA